MKPKKIPDTEPKKKNEEPEIYAIKKTGENKPLERRDFLKGVSILAGTTLVGCSRNIKSELNEDDEPVFDPKEYENERIESESCGDLVAHSESVNTLCFSPDGKFLASGSDDNTIKIWTVSTGSLNQTLNGSDAKVNVLCFSPDGKQLFYGNSNKLIEALSVSSGELIQSFSGHVRSIISICSSPDGTILASGSEDDTIKLWSVPEGKSIETFYEHSGSVNSVQFSPDGKLLVSGGEDGTIKLWSVEDLNLIQSVDGHSYGVDCVKISPDGKMLVSAGRGSYYTESNSIKLWSLPDGKLQHTIDRIPNGRVMSMAFSADGAILATGNEDDSIDFWTFPAGKLWKTLDHSGEINAVHFNPNGKLLASGSSEKTIKLWEWDSVGEIEPDTSFDRFFAQMSPVVYANSGHVIGSRTDTNKLDIIDVTRKRLTHTIRRNLSDVSSLSISKD